MNLGIWLNTHNDREAHDKLTDVDGCGNVSVELEGHLGAPLRKLACARSIYNVPSEWMEILPYCAVFNLGRWLKTQRKTRRTTVAEEVKVNLYRC